MARLMNEKQLTPIFTIMLVLTVVTQLAGCILKPDDDSDKPPALPAVLSVSITDEEIVDNRSLTVSWTGNEITDSYRYSLDNGQVQTTPEKTVIFSDLDDGEHVFAITPVNNSLETEGDTITRAFNVDAFSGPGVIFTPRRLTSVSEVTITLEKTPGIMAAHIVITASQNCVNFGTFTPSDTFDETVTAINFTSSEAGEFILDLGFAGDTDGLSGDAITVGTLNMNPVRNGTVRCDKELTILRNTYNEDIIIKDADYITITP